MQTVKASELKPLRFRPDLGENTHKFRAPSAKIGWLHATTDKPGAKFDITIKDALGRVKMQKLNCGNETEKYGELLNFPTLVGEDLVVEVNRLDGGNVVDLFLN